jgi:hypothetical protein
VIPTRIPILAALTVAVTGFLWSPASGEDAAKKRATISVGEFADGSWVLEVDRCWDGALKRDPSSGSGRLDDAQYRPLSNPRTYSIVVSEGGSEVKIDAQQLESTWPRHLWGSRVSSGEEITYELDGSFAGAQFVVRPGEHGLQGELTIFGSGVPILSSERGTVRMLSRKGPAETR